MNLKTLVLVSVLSLAFIFGCKKDNEEQPVVLTAEENEELLGGQATIFLKSKMAFSLPAPGLNNDEELLFGVGNSFFNQAWVGSPASTKARDGLGPTFNARSCSSCHFKDGRGRAPEPGEIHNNGYLIRLSVPGTGAHNSPKPDPKYGGQLQDHSLQSVPTEGAFSITYTEIKGKFADGTPYSLRKPEVTINNLGYGALSGGIMTSSRVAPQMIGLGLLDAIPEETLLAKADPNDANGDGISGRPNYVWDVAKKKIVIGRFGWKANQPNVFQQSAGAFLGDMGITTSMFPNQNCPDGQTDCQNSPDGGTPEISDRNMFNVALYSSSLAVPARRNWKDAQVLKGRNVFRSLGCNNCHLEKISTGKHDYIPAMSNQVIRPYTDLLLHDMGEELADNRPDHEANGKEWRTPPLWGIGLFEAVNGHTNYLHDGRARNLMEAVLWHGGEAEQQKQKVLELSKEERNALIAFLKDL